ncbi:MAG: BtrH N-terminal domain-containing protein [Bacteroidales bacterium]|jgi:hypothetical protein|nr:BtrH N-terminal domain-containing protein [Bacteroidales bacterium]
MRIENYPHKTRIHCETGSIKNMIDFYSFSISEEMIFGIGSGYDFIHFPFPMFNKCETPLFRNIPGKIFLNFTKRMGIKKKIYKFSNPDKAMKALDAVLEKGIPVGLVVEILSLPFFPLKDRSFPAHTIVIVGKEKDEYIVSDCDYHFPIEELHLIKEEKLKEARYPKTLFSPKGKMFYLVDVSQIKNIKKAIRIAIKDTCHQMLGIPFPYFGAQGIRFLAKRMRKYEKIYGRERALDNLKWQLQTSEEAGTGGSGYRYMYATFLKEAAYYLQDDSLLPFADEMRKVADQWQFFAVEGRRYYKNQENKDMNFLADILVNIAEMEKKLFVDLRKWLYNK